MSYTSFRKWNDARPDQLFALLKSSYRLYDSLVLAKDPAACHFQTVLKEDEVKEPYQYLADPLPLADPTDVIV